MLSMFYFEYFAYSDLLFNYTRCTRNNHAGPSEILNKNLLFNLCK